jgi:starch phosphorylase
VSFSGVGNTLNCANRYVRKMIVDSLRYWVKEMHWLKDMHVDGPMEASGTSGMKAAVNGVSSLSVLVDRRHIEGGTGWSIGETGRGVEVDDNRAKDAASLYDKLEQVVMPLFYQGRDGFLDVMRHAIALNGSFFNTHRMMQEYVAHAYSR